MSNHLLLRADRIGFTVTVWLVTVQWWSEHS